MLSIVGFGLAYVLVGKFFPNPIEHQHLWRLGAWLACGLVFLAHIAYERTSRGSSSAVMARRVAAAVAIGGFGLAVVGPLYARWATGRPIPPVLPALALWPLVTGLPAFLLAWAIGSVLRR